MRRWLIAGGAALIALALIAGAVSVLVVRHLGRDVRGSETVEFVAPKPKPTRPSSPPQTPPDDTTRVAWPTYGFDNRRAREAAGISLRPPFRRIWTFRGRALLEFPPAVAYGRIYLPTFDGRFYALDARTGETLWKHRVPGCGWATPAVWKRLVIVTYIGNARSCAKTVSRLGGVVVAYDADSGKVVWRRATGPNESSPLIARGRVFVGDWNGEVWALDARTGTTIWRSTVGGAIKGSLAASGGRLFVGAYDGAVYSLAAGNGRILWRTSAQARLGSRGNFYSTPAVAYGRVYIGSTDGKVYSFGARSGKLRWSKSTGGYVYSSPALWRGSVLIGSYDQSFYALDAATGDIRWRFRANGPISGAATVIAGVVYFSTFAERTYGLDAANGRQVWAWSDGKYSPVVADSQRLYLVGQGRLYGMVETSQ